MPKHTMLPFSTKNDDTRPYMMQKGEDRKTYCKAYIVEIVPRVSCHMGNEFNQETPFR